MTMERCIHVMVTTLPTLADAETIAKAMVGESLVACAQIGDGIHSFYREEGKIKDVAEVRLTLKVRADRLEACIGRLQAMHPYETPQILTWPVDWVDPGYLAWAYGEGSA